MGMVAQLSYDAIMERFSRLDESGLGLRFTRASGKTLWLASSADFNEAQDDLVGYRPFVGGGSTPEEAIHSLWNRYLKGAESPGYFIARTGLVLKKYPLDVIGISQIVCVRWDEEAQDWKDFVFTDEALQTQNMNRENVLSYQKFRMEY